MFKKLKEKITEEVKSSPQRLQQLLQQQQQQQNTTAAEENFFSLSEDDVNASTSTMEPGFTNISLTSHPQRSRRNSNSSIASDVSFLPRYESSPNMYHLQSDFEVSASEMEDNASTSSQLGHLSKEQIYSAFQKAQKQHHKYRGRYVDLAKHYKELERENAKMKSVLVETQDKAIRRVAELKEQCNLEQKAKAHLENALRVELDEKQYKIETLQTQVGLLQQTGDTENHSKIVITENSENLEVLKKDLNDARIEIENLNGKLQEMKANSIVLQSKENDYKNKITNLEKQIVEYTEREKENNLKLAENKMELHNELLAKDAEILNLKTEIETLKQPKDSKTENLQIQNKKLIEKVETLTQKCNSYEGELLKLEQYKIEINTLNDNLKKLNTENSLQFEENEKLANALQQLKEEKPKLKKEFEEKLTQQRDSAKQALISLEERVKEKVISEYAEREEKIRSEFLQRIENLTTNEDSLKQIQTKLFKQEDLNQNLLQENRTLNEHLQNFKLKYKELEDNHLELIKESSEYRNKITELNKELEETRNTNNGFEDEVSRLTANLKKFQEVLAKVKSEKQQILDEKAHVEVEFEKFRKEKEALLIKLDSLQQEKQADCDLTKQFEDLQQKYSNSLDENQTLKDQIEEFQKTIVDLESSKGKSEKTAIENQQLIIKIEELKSDLLDFRNDKEAIQQEKQKLSDLTENLQQKFSHCLDENQKLKCEIEQFQTKLAEFAGFKEKNEIILLAKQDLINKLESELGDYRKEKEELLETLQQNKQKILDLTTQFDDLKHKYSNCLDENQNLKDESSQFHAKIADLESFKSKYEEIAIENQELTTAIKNLESDYRKEKEALLEKLETQQQEKQEISHSLTQLEDLQKKFSNCLDENQNLKLDIQQFQQKIADLERCKEKNDRVAIEHQELTNGIKRIESELIDCRKEKESLIDKLQAASDLTTQFEELQRNYSNCLNENENLKSELEQLQETTANLENSKLENRTLINKIENLESELLDYKSEIEKTSEDLMILRNNENELNQKLSECQEQLKIEQKHLQEIKIKLENLSMQYENAKGEISELQKRNVQLSVDNRTLTDENSILLNEISELKIKLDLAQIEVGNYREIADKIASEKQYLIEENNNLKADFEKEKQEFLKSLQQEDLNELKETINKLQSENSDFRKQVENLEGSRKEKMDLDGQLKQLERQYSEILHEKQLLQDEVEELKTAPLNFNKLDNLKILKTENDVSKKQYEDEINGLHEKLIQYQSMELTNKSSIEFYQNEMEKLKIKNEKLTRKLDETLVTLNHCADLGNSTEIEYLRNVLYNYMLGKESIVLARVIAAVCKFDEQQTEMIMQKEQQRQSLLGHLGIL